MKIFIQLFVCFLMIACSSQSQKLSENKFTNKYLELLANQYPKVNFKIKEPLVITAKYGDEELTHYLDNAFKEYSLAPDDLNEILERYVAATGGLYEERKPIDVSQIVPIIKPSSYFEGLKQNGVGSIDLVWEKYNEDLIIIYAEDKGNSFGYFGNKEFEKLNIQKDTLLNFAVSNLKRIIPEINLVAGDGEYGLTAGGDYEANLILLDKLWSKKNFDVDGDIIVAIPNRDLIFVTGSNNKAMIQKLKNNIEEYYNSGNHPISNSLYRWNGTKFEKALL